MGSPKNCLAETMTENAMKSGEVTLLKRAKMAESTTMPSSLWPKKITPFTALIKASMVKG